MSIFEDAHGTISVGALKGSTTADLYQFCIPMMILTTFFFGLRVYVRGFMTKTFGVEDWLIIPAYALFMVPCVCLIVIGQWLLSENVVEGYPKIIKLTVGNSAIFIVDQILIKLSVAAYFYRICEGWQRHVIVGSVSIFTLYSFAFIFVSVFQCGIPTVSNLMTSSATGVCISWPRIVKPLLYISISLNAACDWVFVLACLPVLVKLRRMPSGEILCVCFLIFLATGASALSLVRIKYFPAGGTDVLLLKQNKEFAVLSFAEAGTAIITVCMATLHPLLQAFVRKRGSSAYPVISSPRRPESEQTLSEKKRSGLGPEEISTEHSSIGRLGVLPTIYDTEMGTMAEQNSHRHYTNGWNG